MGDPARPLTLYYNIKRGVGSLGSEVSARVVSLPESHCCRNGVLAIVKGSRGTGAKKDIHKTHLPHPLLLEIYSLPARVEIRYIARQPRVSRRGEFALLTNIK